MRLSCLCTLTLITTTCIAADDGLPRVADKLAVSIYAAEPLVRNPCAMAFDARGRLFVSQGPQYRRPQPDTPGDRITILIDSDGDGTADTTKTFADGLNHVQGMAWRGRDLWVANAPELTVVRDIDGDDVADEYEIIYGGLGNIEHALHGLNFAPDGRLYMTKGNSKGYMDASSSELYLAPKAFAELWGVPAPKDAPEIPGRLKFRRGTYRRGYHQPNDDWGNEGGVLRCDADGTNLEIVSRGMRNPWDMAFDEHFDWLLTDQDQDGGDRILNPFYGSHFGWGHPWSAHWTGENHLPSVPISGPVFHGSGTGVVFSASKTLGRKYQGVFLCADWLNRSIFVYRPEFDGALMRNMDTPEVLVSAPTGRTLGSSSGIVFEPTDIEIGPDGALWVLSWGHGYGARHEQGQQIDEGRVYRIAPQDILDNRALLKPASMYSKPITDWSYENLMDDLQHDRLPVRRINAQDEFVRRLNETPGQLLEKQSPGELEQVPGHTLWKSWAIARSNQDDRTLDLRLQADTSRIQSAPDQPLNPSSVHQTVNQIRMLAFRFRDHTPKLQPGFARFLASRHPRIRMAALGAMRQAHDTPQLGHLIALCMKEEDRAVFYSAWQTLRARFHETQIRGLLKVESTRVQLAAALALLEDNRLTDEEARRLRLSRNAELAALAGSYLKLAGTDDRPVIRIVPVNTLDDGRLEIDLELLSVEGTHVRFTTDGAEPSDTNATRYSGIFQIAEHDVVSAALFKGRSRLGPIVRATWRELSESGSAATLARLALPPVRVTALRTANGDTYRVAKFRAGAMPYINRRYSIHSIPAKLSSATMIQTSNSDSDVGSTGDAFLTFTLNEPSTAFIAHDTRITNKPEWLKAFRPTDLRLSTGDTSYRLFTRNLRPGKITLGGNTTDGTPSARSQYFVILKPEQVKLTPLKKPTETATAIESMEHASPQRGAMLFFGAAGCSNCHRLGNAGNAFAPDLTRLGKRATSQSIIESVLKPNAVIMEGYHTLTVITDDGKVVSGFIRRESGLNLELVQSDGRLLTIPRSRIEVRKRQEKSAMPADLGKFLTPQHVADLAAFILTSNEGDDRTIVSHPLRPGEEWGDRSSGFHLEHTNAGQLQIRLDDSDIAEFHFQHNRVRRPFFSAVKTRSGEQVSRRYPPEAGVDPTDHADMHPGLWLAFARLNEISFWHNSGAHVEHVGFVTAPDVKGALTFATRDRYVTRDGDVICRQNTRYRFVTDPDGWRVDIDAQFTSDNEFHFGVREEMGLGIRVATPIRVKDGNGMILSSTGGRDEKGTWGKVARWWDYAGKIGNKRVGMMIMVPEEGRDVWSHSRDYGVLVANPFPVDVKQNRKQRVDVNPGDSFRLRFGVLVHDSDVDKPLDRQAAWKRYANPEAQTNDKGPVPAE